MSLHREAAGQNNIHVIHAFEFADATDRAAGTGYTLTPDDVKKVALQLDDDSYWVLTDDSPITWVAVGGGATDVIPSDGWVSSPDTWTYASADDPTFTFTIAGVDRSAILTPGTRIKLTQTTAKYFIVTKVAFSTDTTVTIYGGTDYDLANAAITAPFYSHVKGPAGFPLATDKWTVESTYTSDTQQSSPVNATWYNIGTFTIVIPIGVWNTYYEAVVEPVSTAAQTGAAQFTTLSTANNSEVDKAWTAYTETFGPSGTWAIGATQRRSGVITLTSKTTHYLNHKTVANHASIYILGATATAVIRAVCAYL